MYFIFITIILASSLPLLILFLLFFRQYNLIKRVLESITIIIEKYLRFLGLIISFLFVLMIMIVVTIVFSRYVFGISSTKLTETIIYLHASIFLLVAPMTLSYDGHVRIDLFYAGSSERYKALVNLIGSYLFLIPLCLMILVTSKQYVINSWIIKEGSFETDGLPFIFLLKTLIPVFSILMIMQGIAIASSSLLALLIPEIKENKL